MSERPVEPGTETETEPPELEIEIETEPPAVEPESVVETEPVETEPIVKSDKSNEFEDYDYNGSVRSEFVTSEFDDSDFSVEDMSQLRVVVGIDFEGNVRVPPSVRKEMIDSESESKVYDSLHSPNESDSDFEKKKKKQRFSEFNSAADMYNLELKVVVDSENHSSWCWFLKILLEDLELINSHYVSFIIDKQKGLVEGLPEVFSHSEHRTCVRHLYMNFKLKFTGKALKDALWKAAGATYLKKFEGALSEIEALSPKAHEWTCKGVIGGNSQLNQKSSIRPQTQPSRGRIIPKLLVKRLWGIRIQDATTSIPSEQVPHHHRPLTFAV
ncbi:hypothetical protein V6N13_125837 [Hibiscus sabdariffa]